MTLMKIAERFDFQKKQVRKTIRAHKGISVYRDSVLVLPKSDNARDWLGLDLRRVSKVGTTNEHESNCRVCFYFGRK